MSRILAPVSVRCNYCWLLWVHIRSPRPYLHWEVKSRLENIFLMAAVSGLENQLGSMIAWQRESAKPKPLGQYPSVTQGLIQESGHSPWMLAQAFKPNFISGNAMKCKSALPIPRSICGRSVLTDNQTIISFTKKSVPACQSGYFKTSVKIPSVM